jgi:hypothetical protein
LVRNGQGWRCGAQRGEVTDLARVKARLEAEVELVDGFMMRELGQPPHCSPEPAAVADTELFFDDQVEEVKVAELFCVGALAELSRLAARWVSPSLPAWALIRVLINSLLVIHVMRPGRMRVSTHRVDRDVAGEFGMAMREVVVILVVLLG